MKYGENQSIDNVAVSREAISTANPVIVGGFVA